MGRVTVKPVAVGSDEEKSGDSLMREHHPGSTNGLPDTGSSPLPGSGSPVAARCFSGRPQDRSPGPLDRLGRTEKKSSGTGASTTPAYGLRVRSSRDGRRQQKKDRIAQKMVDSDVHDPLLALPPLFGHHFRALASGYPLPFDPFGSGESFGCKHLLVPGAQLLPREPVIDTQVLPGWKEVPMKDGKNRTIETLVIKGSVVVHKKDKDGNAAGPPMILIPAGGLVYDATPFETHLPVGDRGVIFGKEAILAKKEVQAETCRNFSVLAGRSE